MNVWDFKSSPKLSTLSERCRVPEQTERLLPRLMRSVPITRVSELTPLDLLDVPVFAAVTPLARDLTTHAGKGASPLEARLSAVMEAVERVSAEGVAPERVVRSCYSALPETERLDPRSCDLPDATSFREDREFSFVVGRELLSRRPQFVPLDLVISPPEEGILSHVDTNGLAAGNTHLEAVVHAICEVIERDALSQFEFCAEFDDDASRASFRAVHPQSLPGWSKPWQDRIRQAGMQLRVHQLRSDLRVPTLQAILYDPRFSVDGAEALATFPGFGSHPNAEVALRRCLSEAFQARTAYLQGARDSFNVVNPSRTGAARRLRLRLLTAAPELDFSQLPSFESSDLLVDLEFLLTSLADVGLDRVVAVDLTRPDFGVPVVRVRVPGLQCFVVNQRRIGWRCWRLLVA